ncbi:MAG: GTPase HflX [Thermoanaerobaculia bacterium]
MPAVPTPTSQPIRRALLVGLALRAQPRWRVDDHLGELAELARSAGLEVAGSVIQTAAAPHVKTFIGPGKAEEVGRAARQLGADLLIFDDDLSASQVKALEELCEVQVLDRSGLILELFRQRARSREARTQVELAQLNYLLPRLTRRWGHLSRQMGGTGTRGGEGETQLEADRRALRRRIQRLERDLETIERTRGLQRRARRDAFQVALAGYTNAGKSTLFNRLTHAEALAEDRLFATLDSKLKRGGLGGGKVAVFADTVGFIRKLPHHLVASFRSTLEEIAAADLVLHVVDRSHPLWEEQLQVGEQVLADLGVPAEGRLTVFNKVDRLDPAELASRNGQGVWVSAATGEGLAEGLLPAVRSRLAAT